MMKQELIIKKKKLPEGWRWVNLNEISNKITDGTHKTPNYTTEGIKFISIANLKPFRPIDFDSYIRFISEEEHRELIKRCCPEYDDILIPKIGTLGFAKRIDIDEKFSIFVGLALIKPKKEIVLPKYLECYLNSPSISKISKEKAQGGGRHTLPLIALKEFSVLLPPISEQQKIVSKLDKQMEQIEMMKREAEKDLISSKELLNSILDDILFGVQSREWSKKKLGEVLKVKGGYAFKSHYFCNEGIPVIKISNVTNKVIDWTEKSYLPKKFMGEHKDFRITKGDILVAMTRPVTKSKIKVAIYQDNFDSLLNQRVGMLDFNEAINRQFLLYLMYSPSIRKEFENKSKTSQQPNISPSQIEDIDIMLPDKKTQEKVVFKINKLVEQTDLIVEAANSQLNTVNQLPSSILNELFGQYKIPEAV